MTTRNSRLFIILLCISCCFETAAIAQDTSIADMFSDVLNAFGGEANKASPAEVSDLSDVEDLFTDSTNSENSSPAKPKSDGEKIEIQTSYNDAVSLSQLNQRPILAIFGAEWCSWCHKLEAELKTEAANAILKRWIVVKIDVDESPELAQKFQAYALPSLRILGLDQTAISDREGYLPLGELQQWLDENLNQADPAIQRVLYDPSGTVNQEDLQKLLSFLSHRTPEIRTAAQQRLISARADSAGAVVDTLRTGDLSQQLCAIEILRRWQAPLQRFDPWQTTTPDEAAINDLLQWLRDTDGSQSDTASTPSAEPVTSEQINAALQAAFTTDDVQRVAAIARAVQLGSAIAPDLRVRLTNADDLTELQVGAMREILYRVLAGPRTRLEKTSVLTALTNFNGETHRHAAITLLPELTSQDQPLIEELSRDGDVLVREQVVMALQRIGALKSPELLKQLLNDSSPSVRTAVLRQLAEHPNDDATKILLDYLQGENDEDLLVYATKTLGQLSKNNAASTALVKLAKHSGWRVRAAALDALKSLLEKSSHSYSYINGNQVRSSAATPAIAEMVFEATQDEDAFVADKAKTLLPELISEATAAVLFNYIASNPTTLDAIDKGVESYERESTFAPLVAHAETILSSLDSPLRPMAITLMSRFSPERLKEEIPELLASDQSEIRLSGMKAMLACLTIFRNDTVAEQVEVWRNSYSVGERRESWHPVPETYTEIPYDAAKRTGSTKPADDETADVDSTTASSEKSSPSFNAIDDFFGGSATTPTQSPVKETDATKPTDNFDLAASLFGDLPETTEEIEQSKSEQQRVAPKQVEAKLSQWLAKWQLDTNDDAKPQWVVDAAIQLRQRLESFNQAGNDNAERQWIVLLLLASGDTLMQSQLDFASVSENTKASTKQPTLADALPWLTAVRRFEFFKQQSIDWSAFQNGETLEIIKTATVIDDFDIAEYIFSSLPRPFTDRAKQHEVARMLLQRALFGGEIDELTSTISENELLKPRLGFVDFDSSRLAPGVDEAVTWLTEKYSAETEVHVKALLLSLMSSCDHALATQSSVGLIESTTEVTDEVQSALLLALSDLPALSADRAAIMLNHSNEQVTQAAMTRLLSEGYNHRSTSEYREPVLYYSYQDEQLGLSMTTLPLSVDALNKFAAGSDKATSLKAKILLLATGKQDDSPQAILADAKQANLSIDAALCLVLALAKAERSDEQAIEFYTAAFADIEDKTIAYTAIREIANPAMTKLRSELRDLYGASELVKQSGF